MCPGGVKAGLSLMSLKVLSIMLIMRRSIRKFNIPPGQTPRANPPGIWTFEDWLVQIPSPQGKKAVQVPHQLVLKYLFTKPITSSIKHFTRF